MIKEKLYLPNLNGLRCIAAFMVLLPHIEQLKSLFHIPNFLGVYKIEYGHLGVILFFVLSGFLITYLLLSEERATTTISIKQFYIRRILRIWPLYFLIISLSLFLLPHIPFFNLPGIPKERVFENFTMKVIFYFTFLANFVHFFGRVPFASQTWSIGTEEQFYLIWPALLKYIRKHRIRLMVFIILGYMLVYYFLASHFSNFIPAKAILFLCLNSCTIHYMAVGSLFAAIAFNKGKLWELLQHKTVFYLALAATIVLLIPGLNLPRFPFVIHATFYGILIMNLALNRNIGEPLENPAFNYLGKISYGLYMYHPLAAVITIRLSMATKVYSNFMIYPVCIGLTLILAGLSYKYFESNFLQYKSKFSTILSGDKSYAKEA